jgi:cardiolipin synthase
MQLSGAPTIAKVVPPVTAPVPAPVDDAPAPAAARTPVDDANLPPAGAPDAVGSAGWKLWNEQTATRAIVDAIDGANKVVNAEFFAITDGGKGRYVVDALERAARRGVEVNVLTDSTSLFSLPVGSYMRMKHRIEDAGGTVFSNVRAPIVKSRKDEPALQNVNHRKVVTVDGTTAFTGGINYIKLEDHFEDSMVQLSGVSAARLAADQLDRWTRANGSATDLHRQTVADALKGASLVSSDPNDMHVLANAPEQQRVELTDAYKELIKGAKERVWISSAGYSDQELMDLVTDAARRGVDVRMVTSGKAPLGLPIINWVGQSHLREAMREGAKAVAIPGIIHRKALIADDEVVFSSFNMTGRSKQHLHEVGLRTKDPEFVEAVADVVARDMERGTTVAAERRDVGGRVGDFLVQQLKLNY